MMSAKFAAGSVITHTGKGRLCHQLKIELALVIQVYCRKG